MNIISLSFSSFFLLTACLSLNTTAYKLNGRETLDISINLPNITNNTLPTLPSPKDILAFVDVRLASVYSVIQNFKNVITSDPFNITKSWVGSDLCSYAGFYCDHPPDNRSAITIASIDLNGYGLSAPSIEGFIDQFPDLALFHANSNNFGGTVPSKISSLRYLYEFDISNNKFTGPFPVSVLGMKSLTFLDIRFNSFSGSVPPQIFTLNLDALFINDNCFTESLPETLGETHIQYLTLANNNFNGPLPKTILKSLSSSSEVLLLHNKLSSCLPYEIGYLKGAVVFDVSANQLTGPLPFSLECLEKVEQLNFADNLLFGMVPEAACQLENLVNLSLSDNYFTHVGPACRFLIQRGVLDLRNNCVPDLPSQRAVSDCAKFFAQPRHCPHMWWFHPFIPCKPNHFHGVVAPSP